MTSSLFSLCRFESPNLRAAVLELCRTPVRWETFAEALQHFAIFVDSSNVAEIADAFESIDEVQDPRLDVLREFFISRRLRVAKGPSWEDVKPVSFSEWERSMLGGLWKSCLAQEGQGVVSALAPAFQSNTTIRIIDPSIGNARPYVRTFLAKLVDECSRGTVRSVRIITEWGMPRRDSFESAPSVIA